MPTAVRLMRLTFRRLGPLLPGLTGAWAYRLWFSTRRFPVPARETRWLSECRIDTLPWRDYPLTRYQWGDPAVPAIVLIHGWNGRGSQLGAFAEALTSAGFRAVAFDAPAHGRNQGSSTNIFDYAEALQTVAAASGPIAGAIAHSFGVPATARALLQGLALPRLVSISAPANATFLVERFARLLEIPEVVIDNMRGRIERKFGMDVLTRLAAEAMLAEQTLPGLIIHDRNDRDVPSTHAEQLHQAWQGSQLLLTDNLGHNRILRDDAVIKAAVDFLADEPTGS